MAYEPLTQSQYQKARNAGYSDQQILEFEKRRKQEAQEVPVVPEAPESKGIGGALKSVLTGTAEQYGESARKIVSEGEKLYEKGSTAGLKDIGQFALRTTGEVAKSALAPIGEALKATGIAPAIGKGIAKVHETGMKSPTYQNVWEQLQRTGQSYSEWKEQNPDAAENIESAAEIGLLLIGEKPLQKGVEVGLQGTKAASTAITKTGEAISAVEKPIAGIGQKIKEGVQAIPRVAERVGVGLEKSADKATRLKTATPEVKKAIESGLDDKIINFVTEADDVTKDAMKKVVRMAEEKPVLGKTNQPSVVAGDLAVKQYNLIDAEKKRIGKQIGDRINALSKTTTVDIKDSLTALDDILNSQGILKTLNKKGKIELDFTTSKFTKAERTKISELYKLATEGGSKLTPAQIKAKDQLFSKMQRESKMESIGDIIIDTPEGKKNLFQAFRDVYNSKLDSIDPTIRELNRKYPEMARITDDIEDSILRTPNFNITKSADQSEFAKVNLRRLFAENQSSATYDAIVKQMDDWARVLGYTDASPKEIMDFSLEMRRLFPETVPKTGFTGGINAGVESTIVNTLGKALTSGKPNLTDQQKALKALLGIDDVILPKLNQVIEPRSKIDANLPKNKVDKVNKVELPRKIVKAEEPLVQEAKKYKSAEEFIKAQGTPVYHGGTEIKEVGNMRSKWGAFYMTDNPTYAKSYGGNKSVLNKMVITKKAKLADLIKPSDDLIKQIDEIISPKATGETIKIKKPDGSFVEVPKTKGGLSNPVHSSADIIQGIKDGKAYYAEMPEVKEALKKLGYDGMITQESKFGVNYGVWNKKVIKTKSQLIDIWNKAQGVIKTTTKATDKLLETKPEAFTSNALEIAYNTQYIKPEATLLKKYGNKKTNISRYR